MALIFVERGKFRPAFLLLSFGIDLLCFAAGISILVLLGFNFIIFGLIVLISGIVED